MLWENDIGELKKGTSYKFIKVRLREYNGTKYLSINDDSIIELIPDIENIVTDDEEEQEMIDETKEIPGEIIAVLNTTDCLSCINCNGIVHTTSTITSVMLL